MLSLPYIVQHLTHVHNLCINHLTDINNYCPISILSSMSKPLEKHVHQHLLKYLDRFNVIHTHQSGFRPQHSCQSTPTCLVDRLLSSINDSKLNGGVFLDLKNAFDYLILLRKKKKREEVSVKRQCHSVFVFVFNHILVKENRKYLLLDIIHLRALSKLEFQRVCSRASSLQYLYK